jgi:ClpP class serine protease
MTPTDFFWIFLIFITLQPLMRQKALEFARRRCLARLEKQRSSRVIIMVHRQETMALLGFPIFRFIDTNDSEEIIRAPRRWNISPSPGAASRREGAISLGSQV